MVKITIKELEALSSTDHGRTLREDGNLIGKVLMHKQGLSVQFHYRFKWEGKYKDFACGTWPRTRLLHIRDARDSAKQQLKQGINPCAQKRAVKIQAHAKVVEVVATESLADTDCLTLGELFETWLRDGVARNNANAELRRSFSKDVLPPLANKPLNDVTEHDLRTILRKVIARNAPRRAISLFADITQMLSWAEKRQPWRALLIDGNPAHLIDIDLLLPETYEEERSRILSHDELRELHQKCTGMADVYSALPAGQKYGGIRPLKKETELTLWICLGTLCRIGELLAAEWRHVNLDSGEWFIPAKNVKGRRGNKQDHHIFLSPFSLHYFQVLYSLTGTTPWCFPDKDGTGPVFSKTVSKQVGDRQEMFKKRKPLSRRRHDNSLVLAKGTNGAWTPHDLRRTGATMMQALGVNLDVIDRCQNHVLAGSRVRRHYLHHDYAREKAEAWARLGTQLESIIFPKGMEHTQQVPEQKIL